MKTSFGETPLFWILNLSRRKTLPIIAPELGFRRGWPAAPKKSIKITE
jgi:hypothetical protein